MAFNGISAQEAAQLVAPEAPAAAPPRGRRQGRGRGGSSAGHPHSGLANAQPRPARKHHPLVDPSKVVKRPIPQTRDAFISQVLRRFGGRGKVDDVELPITLVPSDPDFPYPIDKLNFTLAVPEGYPVSREVLPSIKVTNQDIPVGFKINIERGFDKLAATRESATLLDLLNALDKCLEEFLALEKASTLKIVPNLASYTPPTPPTPAPPTSKPPPAPVLSAPRPAYTDDQRAAAKAKRDTDTRQLEARLKQSPTFRKSGDGIMYTVPLEPRMKDQLPVPLQTITSVRLFVPLSYNLDPPRIEIPGVPKDIQERVQEGFARQVQENAGFSLMAHLNALASNLHAIATEEREGDKVEGTAQTLSELAVNSAPALEEEGKPADTIPRSIDPDKPHVQVIPRPPEWNTPDDGSGDDYDDNSDYASSDAESVDERDSSEKIEHRVLERGTSLSFPGIQMTGVQLLGVAKLNVTIKCNKCKTECDVTGLEATMAGKSSRPRLSRCEKCSQVLGIGFRQEFIHENSNRLGFFDLANCVISEILPSDFIPQCSQCSTSLPPPGIKGLVRGQKMSTNCRECHWRMSVLVPEIKLLRITFEDETALESSIPSKKAVERARYVVGTELPLQGRCAHYRKSTRWFRFSCCNKVYPCDKCHDEQVQPFHHWEHANRMICGTCSREQQYRPEDCAYCKHSFFRKYTGYWEGGKGTRDKRLLRRNDPRKHKRVGKPVS